MKIYSRISIEKCDILTKQLIITFWESRKIKFEKSSRNLYKGKRGSILGN